MTSPQAWNDVLDRLEVEVERADALLGGERSWSPSREVVLPRWQVRDDLPPLPPEMQERAESLVRRQQCLISRLQDGLQANRLHLCVVDAQSSARDSHREGAVDATA
jgi:hypothetical protein